MSIDRANNQIDLHRALKATKAPEKITQEAFEGSDRHLRKLARLRPGERADAADLAEYMDDLRYTDIQSSLLVYLLPFCLEAWRADLRGTHSEYGGFVEHFYPVLADRGVFDVHLNPEQGAIVSKLIRRIILEEIDDQRGLFYEGSGARPYRWFGAFTTYGVLLPDMDSLWTPWWSLRTVGAAIAAVQYISCLMYKDNENPVFAPWTSNAGGGPPCLWEFEGHLCEHRWLQPNVTFLKGVLNVSGVGKVLDRAVELLIKQPEHASAAKIQSDFPLCIATLESRCEELPQLLEETQQPGKTCKWPT